MFSRFFIDRPIFAAVLAIFIVIAGLSAMPLAADRAIPRDRAAGGHRHGHLPRRQRRGDRADGGRAARKRHQRRRAHDLHELDLDQQRRRRRSRSPSTSAPTSTRRRQIVNNRVKQAETKLPQEVRRQGVTVEKGSSAFLQVLAFYSDDGSKDDLTISNYVTLNVLDALKRVPGTTNVQIFGAKDYAMRIWLRPDRLAQLQPDHQRHRARDQRAERAVRRRQGRPGADRRRAGAWSTRSPRRVGCRTPGSSRRSSCAPTPTAARCA